MFCTTPEAKVRHKLRDEDLAQQMTVRGDAVYPIGCRRPQVTFIIDSKTIRASGIDGAKHLSADKPTVGRNIEDPDMPQNLS